MLLLDGAWRQRIAQAIGPALSFAEVKRIVFDYVGHIGGRACRWQLERQIAFRKTEPGISDGGDTSRDRLADRIRIGFAAGLVDCSAKKCEIEINRSCFAGRAVDVNLAMRTNGCLAVSARRNNDGRGFRLALGRGWVGRWRKGSAFTWHHVGAPDLRNRAMGPGLS